MQIVLNLFYDHTHDMDMIRKFLQLFAIITLYIPTYAQKRSTWNEAYNRYKNGNMVSKITSRYSVIVRGGLTQFYGELQKQDMRGMLGLGVNRKFNNPLSLSLEYTTGKLGGEEISFFNSYFINEYNSVELLAMWDLTGQFIPSYDGELNVNIYGGLGLMMFSANAYDITSNTLLRFTNSPSSARNPLFLRWGNPHGSPGIKKTNERIIPVGLCVDYKLFEKLIFGFDYRFYFVRTDKVDATSGMRLINPEEADSYSKTPNDKFSFLSLSATYKFSRYPKRGKR
ncbi:hypothetical protein SAMN04487995_3389 [Dyadobacter koreensis]|uniref:Outer membrane protein beta-barrel domain-containing protein n=1 Tax=Dyadobacter koreensis TaxID=408657 RepID=A0A1H6W8V5_9BACT|nr:hypothetical protein [Dyadobacter koreensis]SEJ13333.1 hypothetical protein SAMN04487995_3389 [Dyadobacter koreensis]